VSISNSDFSVANQTAEKCFSSKRVPLEQQKLLEKQGNNRRRRRPEATRILKRRLGKYNDCSSFFGAIERDQCSCCFQQF
jgi:hypothetical protein